MAVATAGVFAVLFLLTLSSFGATLEEAKVKDKSHRNEFNNWMRKYGKSYSSEGEFELRLKTYLSNYYYVQQLNEEYNPSTEFELNQFADLSFEEFKGLYLTDPQHCSATGNYQRDTKQVEPVAIDWRDKNVITPVKTQGKCGSCWTFSTTGCLESHHAIKTGKLLSLSEQQLVDCAGAFNNNGCHGGLPSQAFEYIYYNGGLETESDYPYTAKDGICRFNSSLVQATVSGVVNFTKGAEADIGSAVASTGPVSIAFDVTSSFQHYKSGVYWNFLCSKSPEHVNHAVLAVGYNQTESGEKYWIVKNSWGTGWGLKGYFWIERGRNACGLADCASYPQV